MKNFTGIHFALVWLIMGLLGGCSPKGYEKYSYLIKDRKQGEALNRPEKSAEPEDMQPVKQSRPASTPVPEISDSDYTDKLLKTARSYLGVPYRYGGMSRKGIDCSGLMCIAFGEVGESLPHSSSLQARMGQAVSMDELSAGDMVFFKTKGSSRINHVGMVTEVRGKAIYFIHSTTSKGVRIDRLDEGYWLPLYEKGVSILKEKADLGAR